MTRGNPTYLSRQTGNHFYWTQGIIDPYGTCVDQFPGMLPRTMPRPSESAFIDMETGFRHGTLPKRFDTLMNMEGCDRCANVPIEVDSVNKSLTKQTSTGSNGPAQRQQVQYFNANERSLNQVLEYPDFFGTSSTMRGFQDVETVVSREEHRKKAANVARERQKAIEANMLKSAQKSLRIN